LPILVVSTSTSPPPTSCSYAASSTLLAGSPYLQLVILAVSNLATN